MKKQTITGRVVFVDIATGAWGIVDEQGNEWRPVNMPEQLKHEGARVEVVAKPVDEMSIFMWGTPVKIVSFHTLAP